MLKISSAPQPFQVKVNLPALNQQTFQGQPIKQNPVPQPKFSGLIRELWKSLEVKS